MTLPSFLLRGKKPHPGLNELIPQKREIRVVDTVSEKKFQANP